MTTAQLVQRFPTRLVSDATGAAVRSVERWRAGTRPRRATYVRRLDDLVGVLEMLGPSMTDHGKSAWLTSRSAFLGWQRPVDALALGEYDRVRNAARAYISGDAT